MCVLHLSGRDMHIARTYARDKCGRRSDTACVSARQQEAEQEERKSTSSFTAGQPEHSSTALDHRPHVIPEPKGTIRQYSATTGPGQRRRADGAVSLGGWIEVEEEMIETPHTRRLSVRVSATVSQMSDLARFAALKRQPASGFHRSHESEHNLAAASSTRR